MNSGSSGDSVGAACQAARQSLVEFVGPSGQAYALPQGFHCEACRAWFERSRMQARAMNLLPRRIAELNALDGLVVAGLNAGCRQERAAQALVLLGRREVPAELDVRVSERFGRIVRGAPDELDQRVAHELEGGAGLRAERQVSALARLAAPAQLDRLVESALARSLRSDRLPLRRWIAIAATLLIAVGVASIARQAGWGAHKAYEFTVVHTSTASLDPFARSQYSGVSGRWLDGLGASAKLETGDRR